MSLLDEIAGAIGHTPETLAQAVGISVGLLERVIGGLTESGIDVFSAASRLGLTPDGLLRGIVARLNGDPQQQLLNYLLGPVKPMSDPLASLTSQWMQMADLHQNTARAIDRHIQDLFQGSGTESYSGQAADTLWNTHQDFQRYFTTLVDHAQTQHTRHATLSGHADDYVTQMPSQVNRLSAPVAAFGLLSIQMTGAVAPPPLIDPQQLEQGEQELQQWAGGDPDPDSRAILELLAGLLYLLILIVGLIDTIAGAIGSHNNQQNNTKFRPPPNLKPVPVPTPVPTNRLSQEQEEMAQRLAQDYQNKGYTLDDIRALIERYPGLNEAQLRALLNRFSPKQIQNIISAPLDPTKVASLKAKYKLTDQQAIAMTLLLAEHPGLTEANALKALTGPPGTIPVTVGPRGDGPDILFLDTSGNIVRSRDVKVTIDTQFSKRLSDAVDQQADEVFMQMPAGTDVKTLLKRFAGNRKGPGQLDKYKSVHLDVVDPSGNVIYDGPVLTNP